MVTRGSDGVLQVRISSSIEAGQDKRKKNSRSNENDLPEDFLIAGSLTRPPLSHSEFFQVFSFAKSQWGILTQVIPPP